jgi:hypothetical protein
MGDYIITLKCHQNDQQLFEDYLVLVTNWLSENKNNKNLTRYAWSIEKDGTIDRHLHLFITTRKGFLAKEEADKLRRELTTKSFKSIQINLNQSKTIIKHALDIKKISKTPQKVLGYIHKDNCARTERYNITDQEVLDAIKFYFTTERLDKTLPLVSDWKHVTNKNFHAIVEDYIKNKPELSLKDCDLIKLRMVKDRHTFQLPAKDQERYFKELRIAHAKATQNDEISCSQEAYGQEKIYDDHLEDEVVDLIKYLVTLKEDNIGINVPVQIQRLYDKYEYRFN